jgi:tRNA(fMet)-specific endonuclease VapC
MKILLDTSAYSRFKSGDETILTLIRQASAILVPAIVLGELMAGFKTGRREAGNLRELDAFLSSPRVSVVGVDEASAPFYADTYRTLRQAGTPIPTNDLWIAALARQHGAALVSLDRHSRLVAGLLILPEAPG